MVKIALAQTKPFLGLINKNIEQFRYFTDEAKRNKASLIIFPELSLTGNNLLSKIHRKLFTINSFLINELLDESKDISIILGLPIIEENEIFNSVLFIESKKIIKKESKNLLSKKVFYDERSIFTPGIKSEVFDSFLGKTLMLIGEDIFDYENVLRNYRNGVEVIIHIHNTYFGASYEDILEKTIAFYSEVLGINVISVNRCGIEDGVIFNGKSTVSLNKKEEFYQLEEFTSGLFYIDYKKVEE